MEVIEWYRTQMTSNDLPAPLIVWASSEYDANHAAWKSFSGALQEHYYHYVTEGGRNAWCTATNKAKDSWLAIDFGKPMTVDRVQLTARTSYIEYAPKDFLFEASNNGVDWEKIGEFYIQDWGTGTPEMFKLKKVTARMFRIFVKDSMGGAYTSFANLVYGEARQKALTIQNEEKVFSIEKEAIIELPDNSDEIAYKFGIGPGESYDIDANYIGLKKIDINKGEHFKNERVTAIDKAAKKITVKEVF